jgi:hypothetical protein
LKFVVEKLKNTDPVVHNYLLTLFASQPGEDESELLSFIGSEVNIDYDD